jgi:hypothetical protein
LRLETSQNAAIQADEKGAGRLFSRRFFAASAPRGIFLPPAVGAIH